VQLLEVLNAVTHLNVRRIRRTNAHDDRPEF